MRLRLVVGEELWCRVANVSTSDSEAEVQLEGRRKHQRVPPSDNRPGVQVKATHDMMAHGCVLRAVGLVKTEGSFTGQAGCIRRAWCHARISPVLALHSESTTANVDVVDHHDIQVGRSPVGASVDQVQGIQAGSGLQAGKRISTVE